MLVDKFMVRVPRNPTVANSVTEVEGEFVGRAVEDHFCAVDFFLAIFATSFGTIICPGRNVVHLHK